MRIYTALIVTLLCLTGYGNPTTLKAQTYQERQLLKLFHQKTRKPQPAEREAQQREWHRLRQQHEYYKRLKQQKQVEENNNYGKQLSYTQARSNPLLPLKQAGPLGKVFRQSSRVAKNVLERQKKNQFLLKKSRRYKTRNKLRPTPPIFRTQFIAR